MPTTVSVHPWPDPVIDTLGHDPRSLYVETFWLPTLGPTSLLLLRHLAARFDAARFDAAPVDATSPGSATGGIELDVATTSQRLGLGERRGNSSPLLRSLVRLEQFDLACRGDDTTFAVRRNVPPVNRRHVRRLPVELQAAHDDWAEARLAEPPLAQARRRARRIAFTLLEQGDDLDHAERTLHGVGFHPSICREAATWAHDRHREALEAAASPPSSAA